jgi:uncharacterized protein (DUF488 family)
VLADAPRAPRARDADLSGLPLDRTPALLCVERDPEACHRSLIAERLAEADGARIVHIRP